MLNLAGCVARCVLKTEALKFRLYFNFLSVAVNSFFPNICKQTLKYSEQHLAHRRFIILLLVDLHS